MDKITLSHDEAVHVCEIIDGYLEEFASAPDEVLALWKRLRVETGWKTWPERHYGRPAGSSP